MRSGGSWIASAPIALQEEFLESLGPNELGALPYLFEFWAHPHQMPPAGNWRSWVILGGRGAGKTRAGAEWVRSEVEGAGPRDPGRSKRIALVGETLEQVRNVMVMGDSGIIASSPPDRRPIWEETKRRLRWPNGAVAEAYSAHDPERLRGPQFDGAWCDELGKWRNAEATWDMLQFALRLGESPRQVVTTTPRNIEILQAILGNATTVSTKAPTEANGAYLAATFLEEVRARYDGTRLGRQELDGEFLTDLDGALWSGALLDRAVKAPKIRPQRIVVAVDPPVTGKATSDACGIIVAGAVTEGPPGEWQARVIEDATVYGASPTGWARAAVEAFQRHGADRIVAEVNQGGDLVEEMIRQVDALVPYRAVRATKNKSARAEPVAGLYEQGRVSHAPGLGALEAQMSQMTAAGYQGRGSPDRVDALVWALHELIVGPSAGWRRPQVRTIGA
ncbi:MAG: terminase family protein [Pseudomonadota bacterium]